MKKMDEFERNVRMRSEGWGYRSILILLSAWVVVNCILTWTRGAEYSPVPALVLLAGVCVQNFSRLAIRQKMLSGDEEYREPNRFLKALVGAIVIAAVLLAAGTYFASGA